MFTGATASVALVLLGFDISVWNRQKDEKYANWKIIKMVFPSDLFGKVSPPL